MNTPHNLLNNRRRHCLALLFCPLVMQLNGCASTEEIPIINLNPEKIKSLEDLVREMKQAAGKRTPKDVDLNAIYKTLADAFVEYAQEAISLGAKILTADHSNKLLGNTFHSECDTVEGCKNKQEIVKTAYYYLNSPHLWGGKTPFGIDASGFTQMVYRINGYSLLREAYQQASQGEVLSFIEESEPGDLAFFDDDEGNIIHSGIILRNHNIIHCWGEVRIDRIDHSGIFNTKLNRHTHNLRVIKQIFK